MTKLNRLLTGSDEIVYRGAIQSDRDAQPRPNAERRSNAILQNIIQQRKEKKEQEDRDREMALQLQRQMEAEE